MKNYIEKEFNDLEIENNLNKVIICGKFFSHKLNNKYNFKACDCVIYYPTLKNTLFYSEMFSEDCFTNSLKWNENFFKKLRMSFSDYPSKSSYFGIFYERAVENDIKCGEKNLEIKINNEIMDEEDDLFKDFDFGDERKSENNNKYLELHFLVENKDIIAFRLKLREVYDDNPIKTIMSRVLENERIENEKLIYKQKQFSENELEIIKIKNTLKQKEMILEKQKREYIYKFYLLNKEKNKKINELLNQNHNNSLMNVNNFNQN